MVTYIIRWKPQGSSKPNTLKQPVFCLFSIGKRTHSQATPLNFNHQTKKHGSVFPGWRYICGYFPALKIVCTLIIRKGVDFQPAMLDDFISHAIQTNLLEIRAFCKNCSGNHRSFAPLYLPAHPEKSPVNHMFDAKSASKKWVICLILLTFPSQLLSYYLIYIRCVCGCLTKYLCEDLFFSGHHPNQTGFCCHHRSHFRSLGLSTFLILLSTFLQFFRRHPRATLFRSASAAWCIHTTCNKYSLVTSRDYLLSSR